VKQNFKEDLSDMDSQWNPSERPRHRSYLAVLEQGISGNIDELLMQSENYSREQMKTFDLHTEPYMTAMIQELRSTYHLKKEDITTLLENARKLPEALEIIDPNFKYLPCTEWQGIYQKHFEEILKGLKAQMLLHQEVRNPNTFYRKIEPKTVETLVNELVQNP